MCETFPAVPTTLPDSPILEEADEVNDYDPFAAKLKPVSIPIVCRRHRMSPLPLLLLASSLLSPGPSLPCGGPPRSRIDPLTRRCPRCGAHPGEPCHDEHGPLKPYQTPGDLLWVRETWCPSFATDDGSTNGYCYRATHDGPDPLRWKPSIFMPRSACRILLRVVSVRVERLQDITEDDARAEGVLVPPYTDSDTCSAVAAFYLLWDAINGKRAPWASNPWVWVVGFERVS